MNIYTCWYQGVFGYCFLSPHSGWWFIPELDQPDSRVYRNLQLTDVVFVNAAEYRYECLCKQRRENRTWLDRLRPVQRARTVGGLLFLPNDH